MDLSQFADEIKKTGFELEFRVSECLRRHGWTVISNKFYVDDVQGAVREIDLVAYKTAKVEHLRVVTTMVVSCKRSERDAWVILAKAAAPGDPNTDWQPLHAWSNDRALQYMISLPGWPASFVSSAGEHGCGELQAVPTRQVFAFQEMNKKTGKANNDAQIFSAVTSLIKAQAFELGALPSRLRTPAVYQFNLLSIVDADLVRLDFGPDGRIEACATDHEMHVARYIVSKRETFARIHFLTPNKLEYAVAAYDRLHSSNQAHFAATCARFYDGVLKDDQRSRVFLEDVRSELSWRLAWRLERLGVGDVSPGSIGLSWASPGEAVVDLSFAREHVDAANADTSLRQALGAVLKKYYRYEGPSRFNDDIPF